MSEPRPTIVLPYLGQFPQFGGPADFCGPRTAVLGRTWAGGGLVLGPRATIRADGHDVRVGEGFCLGPRSTIHIADGIIPTLVGDRVTVCANAVLHACTLADDIAVEDDVVILDGAEVESRTIIAAGSIVFPRTHVEPGLWEGFPARRVRALEPGELEAAQRRIRAQSREADADRPAGIDERARVGECLYVAPTARVAGDVRADEAASIWFGCEIDATGGAIVIGARSNIQDNSEVTCPGGPVAIGCECVIGHNVRLESCTIGDKTLIGNGAFVRAGSEVGSNVLLAAGAVTEPGQRLESGWLWAGRPARRLSKMDAARVQQVTAGVEHYLGYGPNFRAAEGQ